MTDKTELAMSARVMTFEKAEASLIGVGDLLSIS